MIPKMYMCQFSLTQLCDLRNNLAGDSKKIMKLRERLDAMIDHITMEAR
jgi:hypothetical protein